MLLSRYYHCCAPIKALGVRPPIFRRMLYATYFLKISLKQIIYQRYTGLLPTVGDPPRGCRILAYGFCLIHCLVLSLTDTNTPQLSFFWSPVLGWFL